MENSTMKKEGELVINKLEVISTNRSKKDISDFSMALSAAESVHFPNRVMLYDLYDHILLDGHLYGIVNKRIQSILNKDVQFIDNNGVKVKALDHVISSTDFKNIIRKILESIFYGVSGLEFIPGEKLRFKELPRKHIKPESKTIANDQSESVGSIFYEELNHLWVIGEPENLGLLLNAAPLAIYKRGVFGDWAQFIEIFGQPIRVIYYDSHDVKTKMELREVLDDSGSCLALMIPNQAKFNLFDGKESNADGELQNKFIKSCNNEMSVLILGNTETTTSSKNSGLAQAQEHAKQQNEILKNDISLVEAELNSLKLKSILKSYGLPVENGRFCFRNDLDLNQLRIKIDIDLKVNERVPIDPDYIYQKYGIPKPKNFDALMEERKIIYQSVEEELSSEEISLWDRILNLYKNAIKNSTSKNDHKMSNQYDHKKAQEARSKLLKSMEDQSPNSLNMIAPTAQGYEKQPLNKAQTWLKDAFKAINIFK